MSGSKQRQKNAPSLLLRDDENESLFALLGRGCMVRLYIRKELSNLLVGDFLVMEN